MKLLVAGMVGVMVSVSMLTGCGPGLSHRAAAKAPMTPDGADDVLAAMNAELSQTIGTTTTTGAETLALPESRMAVASAGEPAVVAAPTWGAAGGEGVTAAAPTAAEPAKNKADSSFDQHPYD
jgi:hypothetical protein